MAIPAVEHGDRDDLVEGEPADDRLPALERGDRRQPLDRLLDRVLRRPGARGVAADAGEGELGVEVAEAAGLDREVGRLEQDREVGRVRELRAVEEVGKRAELRRQLLLPEEEERDVVRRRARARPGRARARPRPRRRPSCRVAPQPWTAPSAILPGTLSCAARCRSARRGARAGRRAPLAREDERVLGRVLGSNEGGTSERRCARTSASWRLSDGMSTSSSVRAASLSEELSRGERTGILSASPGGPNPPQGSSSPRRGSCWPCSRRGRTRTTSCRSSRELARTALVEPVAEMVQQRNRPDQRTYVGKGKLEELKQEFRDCGAEVLIVDDELDPTQQRRSRTRSRPVSSTGRS